MKKLLFIFILFVPLAGLISAQGEVNFTIIPPGQAAPAGSIAGLRIDADIAPGWHLYAMDIPPGGPIPTSFKVVEDEVFSPGGEALQSEPVSWFDENFDMETNYFQGSAEFTVPVRVAESAVPGDYELIIKVEFMLCNDSTCLPPQTEELVTTVSVIEGTGITEENWGEEEEEDNATAVSSGALPSGTFAYIWLAMTMGALALLTPCVFPMIPITVSYFTKRDTGSRGRSVFEAGVYSVGIIATFTVIGFLLTFMFGAGGINKLASSPWINSLIALVFILFALSLFGVF